MSTVAAISTPIGKGGIAVIRISGEKAVEIAKKVFILNSEKELSGIKANTAVYGSIYAGKTNIDDGIATVFKAPHSFTGEDTVEISCHGGLMITQRVLEAVLDAGAELAGAGEFTKRAFLNGKITLSQAEAVGGMIDAKTDKHLAVSLLQAKGSLSEALGKIIDRLVALAASVYAFIDYPDEDMTDVTIPEMKQELQFLSERLNQLISTHRYGKAISEGVDTAIVGKPNTGKSSLLNLIVGYDRAIVTDIAGTTRDVISEQVRFGSVLLNLSDTAGIRESDDKIEWMGVKKSREKINEAEIVIAVFDGSGPLTEQDREIMLLLSNRKDSTIAVINKIDIEDSDLYEIRDNFKRVVRISAKTGDGMTRLNTEIEELCGKQNRTASGSAAEGEIILGARQHTALLKAKKAVESAKESLDLYTQDIAGLDIEAAVAALSEVDGRAVSEQIVNEIFSKFCVGK
ncbi:MAG: tRNA uridine-5-carboxymethylaminomethyl(34) synthesis GTPase MnmE [Clostridiales bacterium GWF2_38_85]|nr:MAG: tRNA uridine-5-carboxymethylaminomethyl(34) synthesis GTPase MnmE [Clostridiales bacterium GWF2_38_85]HBL85153.1 tRNA uridine-5-carboxymethylaminomethyl(34) synthesis GTPase MnmE [Clostridiales bacterium]